MGGVFMDIDRVKELAYNRYELRKIYGLFQGDTDKDDWEYAEHIVKAEEWAKNADVSKLTIDKMRREGISANDK
jgi:hypothetical protein